MTQADFEEAIERVLTGLQKKSHLMTPAEKRRVAHHESGHALIALLVPGADPLHKISIIPRGVSALGYTLQVPAEDKHILTEAELKDRIAVLLGGRAAEAIAFGDFSTGAADDLQKATALARRLVAEFGMSEALGPMALPVERGAFLGDTRERAEAGSEETARAVDREVLGLLREAYGRVEALLRRHESALHALAALLEQKESVDGQTARELLPRHREAA